MTTSSSKSYLEFPVPLDIHADWYEALQHELDDVDCRYQGDFYHITVAFIEHESPESFLFRTFYQRLKFRKGPMLTLDTIGAFTIPSGRFHIIYLTSEHQTEDLTNLIEGIRSDLEAEGCQIAPFKLHVTLARVPADNISLNELREHLTKVKIPTITLQLLSANHIEMGSHKVIDTFPMYHTDEEAKAAEIERIKQAFRNACSNMMLTEDDF